MHAITLNHLNYLTYTAVQRYLFLAIELHEVRIEVEIDYNKMKVKELKTLLDQRGVKSNTLLEVGIEIEIHFLKLIKQLFLPTLLQTFSFSLSFNKRKEKNNDHDDKVFYLMFFVNCKLMLSVRSVIVHITSHNYNVLHYNAIKRHVLYSYIFQRTCV